MNSLNKFKAEVESKIFASAFFVYTNFDIGCQDLYKNYHYNDIFFLQKILSKKVISKKSGKNTLKNHIFGR